MAKNETAAAPAVEQPHQAGPDTLGTVPHLALWNAVVKTDPNYTKSFSRGGGFKGTAINFVYLARKATEQFGPIGIGWGHEVLNETYAAGATTTRQPRDENGDPVGPAQTTQEIVHVVQIKFWYVLGGKRGEFESFGQTTFVGVNKNGAYTDEEAPKKSLTDALSKALSWLGFGADVHLGLFDDNKYVSDRKREFGNGKSAEGEPAERISGLEDQGLAQDAPRRAARAPADRQAASGIDTKALAKTFRDAKSIDELREACSKAKAQCKAENDAAAWAELAAVMDECAAVFGAKTAKVTPKSNGAAAH